MALFCGASFMVSPASSTSEWQDMLSGRLPMREVRAWGKRLAHDGMFRDTLHHIMTGRRQPHGGKCRLGFHVCGCRCFAKPPVTLRRHVDGTRHEYPERNAPPPVAHAHQPFNAPPPVPHGFPGLLPRRDVIFPISPWRPCALYETGL